MPPSIIRRKALYLAHARAIRGYNAHTLALLPLRWGIRLKRQRVHTAWNQQIFEYTIHQAVALHAGFCFESVRDNTKAKVTLSPGWTRMLVALIQYF